MRFAAWLSIIVVFLAGVGVPLGYLFFAGRLPQLESEYDLESHLRGYIEGERLSSKAGEAGLHEPDVLWPRPALDRLPRDLVDLFLSEMGCPTFFQTPRESVERAAWRAFNAEILGRRLPGSDGGCEFALGLMVAEEARIADGPPKAIAAFRIRSFLTKDQLVAYALQCYRAEKGVFGVEESAQVLYHHLPKELNLAQLAELMIAAPPDRFYDDIKFCRNPLLIRQARDTILRRAGQSGLFAKERLLAATKLPVACKKE
jgi:hypothetical protein